MTTRIPLWLAIAVLPVSLLYVLFLLFVSLPIAMFQFLLKTLARAKRTLLTRFGFSWGQ